MINILIVDDEPHARDDLENKIGTDPAFNIIGKCANAFEAIREINRKRPDVVFLDIKMPKISGIEMLSMLDKGDMPRIVFVTAYSEHAIEAFEKNAIDFLLKPVKINRLSVTLERLKDNHQPQAHVIETLSIPMQFIPCYKGSCDYLININNVCHAFSSPTTGTHIVTQEDGQVFHSSLALKTLEENTPLTRCHRQHLVSPKAIKHIEKIDNGLGQIHTYKGEIIPVSRNYMKDFAAIS
ncbi:Autolysis response regulater LytR [hydrothermal vent metagenome]|uniref:Autolysis response regulater LytR n=1 Tax=hydrothermal vent metagenome TaxID=652676 RepID=A0A3B0ZGB9_9ZZZZ